MKTLLLLALAGFVLAVSLAVPFNEDDLESQENELKSIAEDYREEDPDERYGLSLSKAKKREQKGRNLRRGRFL